jgi:hypothetical protein
MNIDGGSSDLKARLEMKDIHVLSHAPAKRVEDLHRGNLPTIDEDQIENETIDFSKVRDRKHRAPQSRA